MVNPGMFKNYLVTSVRNLTGNKLSSAINIGGLSVGLAACILIMLFVQDELTYDRQWQYADTIGRINTTVLIPGRSSFVSVSASSPMKQAVEEYFPNEVVRATRFIPMHPIVTLDGKAFAEDMHWTDPETALMFDLDVVEGDLHATLTDKASLALSETVARKYFGEEPALGKVLSIKLHELERDYRVGAVFRDLPDNTSLDLRALARFDLNDFPAYAAAFDTWLNLGEHLVYVQLKSPDLFQSVNDRLPGLVDLHVVLPDTLKSSPDAPTSEAYMQTLQPLKDIHLNPSGMGEMKPGGNIRTVRIFVVTAALLLLIACINFMNLTTANATRRAREVALRKVMGATRGQLMIQFLGESLLLAVLALLLGLVLVELTLPIFNGLLNTTLTLSLFDGSMLLFLAGIVVMVGLVAGIYPAMVLSGFRPARVLASSTSAESKGSITLRNILVVLQFVISISVIAATATVYTQSVYVTRTDLGYNRDGVMVLNNVNNELVAARKEGLKAAILQLEGVSQAGFTDYSPIDIHERLNQFELADETGSQAVMISTQAVDHDFLETYGVSLLTGRFYERDFVADGFPDPATAKDPSAMKGTIVMNEEAVRTLGFASPADAIGQHIRTSYGAEINIDLEIIGVTPNMYFQSPKKPIRAEVYLLSPSRFNTLGVRYEGAPKDIAAKVEKVWTEFTQQVPFQYEFVDETVAAEMTRERNLAVALTGFSVTIVLVACLGLYGLAAFTAQRRTREIGIRKVLGASVADIIRLLLWQFSKPVLLANLIAWPLTAWMMIKWLEGFPVRIDSWVLLPFCALAGLAAVLIAWITVSGHTARVARAKPVRALRYE
jgi:putative ABC transport system permease protein